MTNCKKNEKPKKDYDNQCRLNDDNVVNGFFAQVICQAKKMQMADWISMAMLILSFFPGKIWKIFNRHIWVVSEYEHLARDNGYWFFKYIRENAPQKTVFYPIRSDSSDYSKINELGNAVEFSSFLHYMLFWSAEKQFTSSKNAGFPSRICEDLVFWGFHRFQYIMLNHGFTRGKSTVVDAEKTNFDYICTCSEKDREIIISDNGQPEKKVLNIGFARHDGLDNSITDKTVLLIMPTWRSWINYKRGRNQKEVKEIISEFLNSDYFQNYKSLLENNELKQFLIDHRYTLYFYLHDYAQFYMDYFKIDNPNVVIAHSKQYDIQELLKKSAMLITDYSSVCYDFAYMHKPVIYYQFDLKKFEYYQYKAGDSFSYADNGVGEVVFQEKDVVKAIKRYSDNNFEMPSLYKYRVDSYFSFHDHHNCERIFSRFCQ